MFPPGIITPIVRLNGRISFKSASSIYLSGNGKEVSVRDYIFTTIPREVIITIPTPEDDSWTLDSSSINWAHSVEYISHRPLNFGEGAEVRVYINS